jgi:hypothetical protein
MQVFFSPGSLGQKSITYRIKNNGSNKFKTVTVMVRAVYKQRVKNVFLPASCEEVEGLVQVKVEMTVEMTADKLVYAFLQQSFFLQ